MGCSMLIRLLCAFRMLRATLSINVPKFAFIQIGIFARASLELAIVPCTTYSLYSFSSVRTMQ